MELTEQEIADSAAAVAAFLKKKPIQTKRIGDVEWYASTDPSWNFTIRLYRPAPWQIPEPPKGKRWHRYDWTEDMLPEGTRPLMLGEPSEPEDEVRVYDEFIKGACDVGYPMTVGHCHTRTARPIPIEITPWTRETIPLIPFGVISKATGNKLTIVGANPQYVWLAGIEPSFTYEELAKNYTLQDGSPYGQ